MKLPKYTKLFTTFSRFIRFYTSWDDGYFLKGSRRGCGSTFAPSSVLDDVMCIVELAGAVKTETCSGSPINASQYEIIFKLLDGQLRILGGNYFCGPRGAYITGERLIKFLCAELDLMPPSAESTL